MSASLSDPSTPPTLLLLLRTFLTLQSRRSETYAAFRAGFRTFMSDREAYEHSEEEANQKRAKTSTVMQKVGESHANGTSKSGAASSTLPIARDLTTPEDRATLQAIDEENQAAAASQPNPEHVFQKLCITIMKDFQTISLEVRRVIAQLVALSSNPSNLGLDAGESTRFASLLTTLQQLEKLKLELTIHQQMLHNQHYVMLHPRAHGQLQEHQHHIHSVTDDHGRVREHPSHSHSHAHDLTSIAEDEQELADNAQPFTRHLSALLSDTAFQSDAPFFLFPPSGAAPKKVLAPLPEMKSNTLKPHLSEAEQEKYENEVAELRDQEGDVIEKINEILEEVRMEVMEQEEIDEESVPATSPTLPAAVHIRPAIPTDCDAIGRIHVESWRAGYDGLISSSYLASLSVPSRQKRWRDILTQSPCESNTFVAASSASSDAGVVQGWASVGPLRSSPDSAGVEDATTGEVWGIYVDPVSMSQGIGSKLLSACESHARSLLPVPPRRLILWCLDTNKRAINFYERNGWTRDGDTKKEKIGEEEHTMCKLVKQL